MKSETIPFQKKYQPSLIIMNKLIIPAIIGIFGLAPGTVTANAAESTTASVSVQILKKKPKALKYGLKHGLKKGLKHGLKKGRINGGKK
ncbi:hypothetical protein [Akkermansia muciniphila]|uniref:hypothetical protein n=2 Tax=Akkermansia muciniphila TaxID=239935 RepID=UPI001968AA72|nr:hypothetical protein [Akkermansia muciniphila]